MTTMDIMTTITHQDYDVKCDSAEEYQRALGDTGDTICLKTLDGIYVSPQTLQAGKNQRMAEIIAEMELTEK